MTYLLDVNALLALGFKEHEFHARVVSWVRAAHPQLATCSITELGFLRILVQAPFYGLSLVLARSLLLRLKAAATPPVIFLNDNQDASRLPSWVKSAKQITDGHLVQLASANGAVFATLDKRIPGSLLIPL
jgi:uncharacterized protein